jgi:hypothetical protein
MSHDPDPLHGLELIDTDAHTTEPHDLWTSRAPASLRGRVPRVVEKDGRRHWGVEDDLVLGTASAASVVRADGGNACEAPARARRRTARGTARPSARAARPGTPVCPARARANGIASCRRGRVHGERNRIRISNPSPRLARLEGDPASEAIAATPDSASSEPGGSPSIPVASASARTWPDAARARRLA